MKKNICNKLGERVKFLRAARGWSQEKFAEISGLHRNYIGMIERGERNPTLDSLEKLADGFEISVSELLKF